MWENLVTTTLPRALPLAAARAYASRLFAQLRELPAPSHMTQLAAAMASSLGAAGLPAPARLEAAHAASEMTAACARVWYVR